MPAPIEIVTLEDARIIFRNFSGAEGMYNRAGDRNFAVVLDKEKAEELANKGWNVKLLPAREEDEGPTPYLSGAVAFDKGRPPMVKMIGAQSGRATQLDADTVDLLDSADIAKVDMTIRPYDWQVRDNSGRKAYLQALYVHIIEDPLALRYENMEFATVAGPMLERTEMMVDPVTGEKKVEL